MGVDFYACAVCGETFCDCGDFVSCGCGKKWCCDECAEEDGYRPDEGPYEEGTCKYCRKEDVDDSPLLEYCLKILKMRREEAVSHYFNDKKEKN